MALTDIFWASGEGDGGGSVSRIYPESHSTNEDVLELVDHWAVTDKTNYHHLLVMSCLQHAIACFFFLPYLEIEYPHSDVRGLLCPLVEFMASDLFSQAPSSEGH